MSQLAYHLSEPKALSSHQPQLSPQDIPSAAQTGTPLFSTHHSSSHLAKVTKVQSTSEHSGPIPLKLQTTCQGTPGVECLTTPDLCLFWLWMTLQGALYVEHPRTPLSVSALVPYTLPECPLSPDTTLTLWRSSTSSLVVLPGCHHRALGLPQPMPTSTLAVLPGCSLHGEPWNYPGPHPLQLRPSHQSSPSTEFPRTASPHQPRAPASQPKSAGTHSLYRG